MSTDELPTLAKVVEEYAEFGIAKYEEMTAGEVERYDQLAKFGWLVGKAQGGPLLDVGCGVGDALELLRTRLDVPAGRLEGAEPCGPMRERAQARNPGVTVHAADAAALPHEAGTVGGLVCICVLQHVSRDEGFAAVLEEWRRVLQPGAPVLLSVWEGTGVRDMGGSNATFYTKDEVVGKLTAHGFTVEESAQIDTGYGMDRLFFQAICSEKPGN